MWTPRWAITALSAGLLLSACAQSPQVPEGSAAPTPSVVVGLYPLQWVVEQLPADVTVTSLAAPGVDPHDMELTAAQMAVVQNADLVIVVPGLQPALDDAVAGLDSAKVLDATAGITLIEDTAHADDAQHHDHATDPHVWLDPAHMITIAKAVADRLGTNANDVTSALEQLDSEFAAQTAQCMSRDLVVSHAAFAYLANAYNLTQWPVASNPDVEPTPRDIADIAEFVRSSKVTTIFTEPLIDPGIAQTIAAETGARTAVLDPLENITPGNDYISVMQKNLAAIVQGLGCAQ